MLKRRQFIAAVAATAVLPVVGARTQEEVALLPDMIMGNPEAPIEIIEYSSMTCPHCAAFHINTLPELKAQYLDTGRAKLVFREFPLDRVALAVSVIARCMGEERFFPFVDVMFRTQEQWSHADDPLAEINKIVRMGGQDPNMVDACLEDQALIDGVLAVRLAGDQQYEINSTPTFIVDGEPTAGNMSFEKFDELLLDLEGNV